MRRSVRPLRAARLSPVEGRRSDFDNEGSHLVRVRGEPRAFFLGHVSRGDVKVAILDQRERIDCPGQFRVAPGSADHGCGTLRLQQADDALVLVRDCRRGSSWA